MSAKTLTDLFIEQGLIEPLPKRFILDGDTPCSYSADDEDTSQNEKKSQA